MLSMFQKNVKKTKTTLSEKKIQKDKIWKFVTFIFSCILSLIFIAIFVFIIMSAMPGFEEYGFVGIFGTMEFNLSQGKVGIWNPLAITLLVTFGAILIATPIGIKTATFIKFRLNPKYRKITFMVVQSLSGIPSVVFGLFALQSLGQVVGFIFNYSSAAYSIINAIIMLAFMVLPTIITLTLNSYNTISVDFISNPVSLGVTKTRAIYKIYKAKARNGIIVAVIIAIGRAFGETMALSMLLTSESYSILNQGVIETLTSGLGTLGSLIATNMFAETGGPAVRGVLYAFGILLFVIVMILNAIIIYVTKNSDRKSHRFYKIEQFIGNTIMWVPNKITNYIHDFYIEKKYNVNYGAKDVSKFIEQRILKNKLSETRTVWWIFWEWFCAIITFGFLMWITFDIIIAGLNSVANPAYSSVCEYGSDTTGQAIINTLIIIFTSLVISVPFSLLIAIYLNEYATNTKIKKAILYFIDCLGSSPSIIFGMFGLVVFIELFGLSLGGALGKSLLAGALTISIVILPSLTRTTQQALEGVPMSVRENAYSLGATKWETIWTVVMRQALRPLITSLILAIGRIMAETAPLYLTAGLTSVNGVGLMLPGQTLTTRIYAQLSSNSLESFQVISYECAFIALVIIVFLIWIGNYVIPNSKNIKDTIINGYFMLINCFIYSNDNNDTIKKLKPQIVGKVLFITYDQALTFKINRYQFKYFFIENKLYRIKFVKEEVLEKINEPTFIESQL